MVAILPLLVAGLSWLDGPLPQNGPEKKPAIKPENLLRDFRDRQRIEELKVAGGVEENLRQARLNFAQDPEGTVELLKFTLGRVGDHPDLGSEIRTNLQRRLQIALREAISKHEAIKIQNHALTRTVDENIAKARLFYQDYPNKSLKLLRATTLQVWDDTKITEVHRETLLSRLVAARTGLTREEGEQPIKGKPPEGEKLVDKALGKHIQVKFNGPSGMKLSWSGPKADSGSIDTPARHDFLRGAVYRLKISKIPDRPMLEVNATLEVMRGSARAEDYLSHCAVSVEFTDDDFKQVVDGQYVVKVIYLPDPLYQEGGNAGPVELSFSQLELGQDPIEFATRRGTVLLIIRMGNKTRE